MHLIKNRRIEKYAVFLYDTNMKKSLLLFTVLLVPLDFIMLFLAGLSAYFLRTSVVIAQFRPVLFHLNLPLERYIAILLAVIPFWIVIFALTGLYNIKRKSLLEEFFQVIASASFAMMGVIIYIFMQREWFDSRFIVLAVWLFAVVYVFSGRFILGKIQRYFATHRQIGVQRVLVIGNDEVSKTLASEMNRNPSLGYRVVKEMPEIKLDEIKAAIANPKIDTVIVGQADYAKDAIVELVEFCQEHRLNFRFAPTLFQALATNVEMDVIRGIPLIALKHTPLYGWGRVAKRTADILGSLLGLLFFAPFFGLIGVLVRLDSRGPVFASLDRVNEGRVFKLYKFRSMIEGAHDLKKDLLKYNERKDGGPLFKMRNDPRVTRVGRVLRKTRIDEFPQLFNVLKGEMSLVGPRPHEPEEVAQYEKHHKKLLAIKPGMTGMAQIYGSSDLPFEQETKLDTYYIENWSLFLDIKILLRTLALLLRDRSAC